MAQLSLRNVVKRFGDTDAVRGINLEIADEEMLVLVGPSGCGKSTTLRLIAGLEELTSGEIYIGGDLVNDLPPRDRDIAMVFQNYALYPHMTVFENMSFGLRLKHFPKDEIRRRVEDAARILDIKELLTRRPKQLSGGQRQRVAMGRAIVRNPKVFLFDEPLSNLDAKLRVQMRTEIKKVHQKVRTTSVYVTHDQVEAMTLADRVVVMNGGRIEQVGPPNELYHHPLTRFVAGFIGSPAMNFLPCRLIERSSELAVELRGGLTLPVPASRAPSYRSYLGRDLVCGLRPEHITESRAYVEGAEFTLPVDVVEPMGTETMIHLEIGGIDVCARCSPDISAAPGEKVAFMAQMDHMHLINPANDEVIPAMREKAAAA
jgi:multiple sugar transport system ATP-binding protein